MDKATHPPLHWKALSARVTNSLRDGTGVPCSVVSAIAGKVIIEVAGQQRTYDCDTDLIQSALASAAEAYGVEPPVEIDDDQHILLIFAPIEKSYQDLGAGGRLTAVPLFAE